jgi:hypothetical protein
VTREDRWQRFGEPIGDACWSEYAAKRLPPTLPKRCRRESPSGGDDLCADSAERLLPSARLAEVMARAGCPQTPEAIGVTAEFYRARCGTRAFCAIATRFSISPPARADSTRWS